MGVSEGKALGEWFGPNTIAQVLKKLVIYDDWAKMAIHVAMDNILISSDVRAMARTKPPSKDLVDISKGSNGQSSENSIGKDDSEEAFWRPLLIIVPLRLGLTTMNRCYLPAIQEYFKLPQCTGIIGGRPNHAVYFYGIASDKLLYLDPHVCQEAVNIDSDQMEPIGSDPQSDVSAIHSNNSRTSMEMVDNPANAVTSEPSSPETTINNSLKDMECPEERSDSFSGSDPDSFEDSTFHCPYLMYMDFESLDPSLALSFLCCCEDDYIDLVERLKPMIAASNPPLFELLEKRPPGFPKFVPYLGDDEALKLKGELSYNGRE